MCLLFLCREFLNTPDNGHLTLDWIDNHDQNNIYPDPKLRPTVVILPGITGKFLSVMI